MSDREWHLKVVNGTFSRYIQLIDGDGMLLDVFDPTEGPEREIVLAMYSEILRLWDGIAEHKFRVDDPLAPAKAVQEYDLRLWALIEEDDNE